MALQLKRAGVRQVHPLEGGFEEWVRLQLPVEPVDEVVVEHTADAATPSLT